MSDEMWTMRTENDDRVRRARSWLRKSKRARSDVERFLYLWISFNAAYGQTADKGRTDAENGRGPSETELQQEFLGNICEQDRSTRWLQAVVLEKECAGAIRDLVKNKWVRLFCVGGPEGSRRGCERHGKSYLTRRRRGEEGDGGGSLTGGAIPSA